MSGPWGSTPWGARYSSGSSTTTTEVEASLCTADATGYACEVEGSTPQVGLAPWASAPWGALEPPVYPYALIDARTGSATASGDAARIEGPTTILVPVGVADATGYACGISFDVEFPFGWTQSKLLIVNHEQVTGSHAQFPVYLTEANLPEEMWLSAYPAQPDGGDIRFTLESDGSRLPLAIVEWVPGTRAKLLVMVPGVNDTTNVSIRVWWGVPSHQDQPAHDDPYGRWAALPDGITLAAPLVGQHAFARLYGEDGRLYRITDPTSEPYNDVYATKVRNGVSEGRHCAFTTLAKLSDGTLLLGYKDDTSHVSTASSVYRLHASTDGGATWALRSTINWVNTPVDTQSFLGMLYVGDDDTVYIFGSLFDTTVSNGYRYGEYVGTKWTKSLDGGVTWLGMHDIDSRNAVFCQPRRQHDGKVLIPAYEWTHNADPALVGFRNLLYVFNPETEVVERVTPVTSNYGYYNEWSVEEIEPGHLVSINRRDSAIGASWLYLYRNESFDGGLTWTNSDATANWPVTISLTGTRPDQPCLLKTHDGKLMLGYSSDRHNGDLRVVISDDNGVSWRPLYAALRSIHDPLGQTSSSFGGYIGLVELTPDRIVASWYYESSNMYGNIYASQVFRHNADGYDGLELWSESELAVNSAYWGGRATEITGNNTFAYYDRKAFAHIHNGGEFSVWTWARFDDVASATAQTLLGSSYLSGGGVRGFALMRDNRGGGLGSNALRFKAENASGTTIDTLTDGVLTTTGSWYMVGARSAGGVGADVHLLVNASEYTHAAEIVSVGTGDSTNLTVLGAMYNGTSQTLQHDGGLAWLWVSTVDLGSDWFDTHYSNFSDPASFVELTADVDIACTIGTATADGLTAEVVGTWFGVPVEIAAVQVGNVASGVFCDVLGGSMLTADDIESITQAVIAALFAAAQETPISANMVQSVGVALKGDGTVANKFRSILVP